ncbi:uncharacterized protein L969DRAFT_86488 [Mixia osmundae IAM 14324]|uniref:Long chronological lifespan protein 2 n=1 Tax=Mixia osmundae (strain CBS 9802 / IAM 14324 / JCM 22182 / KY 12970) TaxID=764103 RepID=G7E9E0_MIXOS|nr:uncharacterized protein L969DRAFT_86488 [Mixia osmundae IAM 14324]KEI39889.1 hypothetical protein L969DRAFT_86488 [Mixia osmundae IAM 14324]GAA99259.1 hypothetical protein E5Q_05953 [Mixia osmundae IAM 14324]
MRFCLILALAGLAQAQFFDFGNMFGGQQQAQQGARPAQDTKSKWYRQQVDELSCNDYLCPNTLDCVSSPAACSCPSVEDIKCQTGPETFVCTRGSGCDAVQHALKTGK